MFTWKHLTKLKLKLRQCLGSGSVGSARFFFLDPDPQQYADPRIRNHRVKNQPKTERKKNFLLKSISELLKKRDYENEMNPKHCR